LLSSALIRNVPEVVLGAFVIHAVAHLADIRALKRYAKLGSWSLWSSLVARSGVLLLGILRGLIFAVALSLVGVMRKLSVPADSILGRLPGSAYFVDVERNRGAEQISGLLRPNGILSSPTRIAFIKHLRELVKHTSPQLQAVVLDLETYVTSLVAHGGRAYRSLAQCLELLSNDFRLWFLSRSIVTYPSPSSIRE
jgi:SulP family sulfate permease